MGLQVSLRSYFIGDIKNMVKSEEKLPILFLAAIICIFLPWASIQFGNVLNGNVSWLIMSAQRLYDGQVMSQHIYEGNPPLSIIIYLPVTLFSNITNLALPLSATLFFFFLLIFSITLTYACLNKTKFLNISEKAGFLIGHCIGLTLITNLYFGDREHLLFMFLTPLILTQLSITNNSDYPKYLQHIVFIFGFIFILLKPHYLLIPLFLIIHRVYKIKNYKALLKPDIFYMGFFLISYTVLIYLFFNDYIENILPDALLLYVANTDPLSAKKLILPFFIGALTLFIAQLLLIDNQKKNKDTLLIITFCCLISSVPAFVQMKGFYNHVIPLLSLFIISILFCFFSYLRDFKKNSWLIYLSALLLTSLAYMIFPINTHALTRKQFNELKLTQFIEKNCPAPCTFFGFHTDIEIMNITAFNGGYTHGTRFPSYWFLPRIIRSIHEEKMGLAPEIDFKTAVDLNKKYTRLVLKDFEFYQPSLLIIINYAQIGKDNSFTFIDHFNQNPEFEKYFSKNYKKTSTLQINQSDYFGGTAMDNNFILTYDIYKRISNNELF